MDPGDTAGAGVLVVEDDASVRDGVSSVLESYGYRVLALANGLGVAAALDSFAPDLALLDIGFDDGPDGFEIATAIRARSEIPLFFLTGADGIEDRVRGFDLGADDYLVKPFSIHELVRRIRAVLRRTAGMRRSVISSGDVEIDLSSRQATRAGHVLALTPIEFDILVTLARTPGRIWSKRALLREVWGTDQHKPHLVEVHVSSIRRKLEEHGDRVLVTGKDGAYSFGS